MMPNTRSMMSKTSSIALVLCAVWGGTAFGQSSPSPAAGTGLEGVIVISPAHPGPTREGVADAVPLANTTFLVQKGNETVASFTTDARGVFRISLPAGRYTVSAKNRAPRIGNFGPFEVDLVEGQFTKVNWTCDSGMR
jgi:hypothetical protein